MLDSFPESFSSGGKVSKRTVMFGNEVQLFQFSCWMFPPLFYLPHSCIVPGRCSPQTYVLFEC